MNWYKKAQTAGKLYVRFGDLPVDEQGNQIASINNFSGKREKGISAYEVFYDRRVGKFILQSGGEQYLMTQHELVWRRNPLLVTGEELPYDGADGEPLLKPGTVRVLRELDPSELVDSEDHWMTIKGDELEEHETPQMPQKDYGLSQEEVSLKRRELWSSVSQLAKSIPAGQVKIYWDGNRQQIVLVSDKSEPFEVRQNIYNQTRDMNVLWYESDMPSFNDIEDNLTYLFTISNGQVSI